ncbi:N-6 DNA methylase [Thermosynechococcus sp. QS41]|nr:N-6 DNA methylase [Thermosynechococcus sp. QS41]
MSPLQQVPVEKTVKSKRRVADHGEVLTPQHIVQAMLDLVQPETERINSRFLEPTCGTGNFLVEILARKPVMPRFNLNMSATRCWQWHQFMVSTS